jgi:hypothetical protein
LNKPLSDIPSSTTFKIPEPLYSLPTEHSAIQTHNLAFQTSPNYCALQQNVCTLNRPQKSVP